MKPENSLLIKANLSDSYISHDTLGTFHVRFAKTKLSIAKDSLYVWMMTLKTTTLDRTDHV